MVGVREGGRPRINVRISLIRYSSKFGLAVWACVMVGGQLRPIGAVSLGPGAVELMQTILQDSLIGLYHAKFGRCT